MTRQRERAIHATKTHIHTHTAHIGVSDEIQGKLAGAPFWEKKEEDPHYIPTIRPKRKYSGHRGESSAKRAAGGGRAATEEP